MVIGVTEGFQKVLEVNGVGYRVSKSGKTLTMNLGLFPSGNRLMRLTASPSLLRVPTRLSSLVPDKQKVGQFAAEVREKRPPEPYKGKGIKYADEHIRRKEGKTGAKKK